MTDLLSPRQWLMTARASLIVIAVSFITACSSSSDSGSGGSNANAANVITVNGYYLSSVNTLLEYEFPGDDYRIVTITQNYVLSDAENALTASIYEDGVFYQEQVTTFSRNGLVLKQFNPNSNAPLDSENGEEVFFTVNYDADGRLQQYDFGSDYLLFEYENNRIAKRQLYVYRVDEPGPASLSIEHRFTYADDSSLESIAEYGFDATSDAYTLELRRCTFIVDNGQPISASCGRVDYNSGDWVDTSLASYQYNEVGNLSVLTIVNLTSGGGTNTITSSYEYQATDRTVPNLVLSDLQYFPDYQMF